VCELEDGIFIAAGYDMTRWDMTERTVVQTYTGFKWCMIAVIELKSDIIVGHTFSTLGMWRVSSGECLRIITESDEEAVYSIVKLKAGYFASIGTDQCIRVWDEYG